MRLLFLSKYALIGSSNRKLLLNVRSKRCVYSSSLLLHKRLTILDKRRREETLAKFKTVDGPSDYLQKKPSNVIEAWCTSPHLFFEGIVDSVSKRLLQDAFHRRKFPDIQLNTEQCSSLYSAILHTGRGHWINSGLIHHCVDNKLINIGHSYIRYLLATDNVPNIGAVAAAIEFYTKPDVFSVLRLECPFSELAKLCERFQKPGKLLSLQLKLICLCFVPRAFADAMGIFESLKLLKVDNLRTAYSFVICAACRCFEPSTAVALLKEMLGKGIEPSAQVTAHVFHLATTVARRRAEFLNLDYVLNVQEESLLTTIAKTSETNAAGKDFVSEVDTYINNCSGPVSEADNKSITTCLRPKIETRFTTSDTTTTNVVLYDQVLVKLLLEQFRGTEFVLHDYNKSKVLDYFSSIGWTYKEVLMDHDAIETGKGKCVGCHNILEPLKITFEDSVYLAHKLEKIVWRDVLKHTVPEELENFVKNIRKLPPFDVVVDALNVSCFALHEDPGSASLYTGLAKLVYLAHQLKTKYKFKRMLFILRRHMSGHKFLFTQLRSLAFCFVVDDVTHDDYFVLLGALRSSPDTYFLSNDFFADNKLRHDETFKRWDLARRMKMVQLKKTATEETSTQYDFVIKPPSPFYIRVQSAADGSHVHIPYDAQYKLSLVEKTEKWLCLQKPSENEARIFAAERKNCTESHAAASSIFAINSDRKQVEEQKPDLCSLRFIDKMSTDQFVSIASKHLKQQPSDSEVANANIAAKKLKFSSNFPPESTTSNLQHESVDQKAVLNKAVQRVKMCGFQEKLQQRTRNDVSFKQSDNRKTQSKDVSQKQENDLPNASANDTRENDIVGEKLSTNGLDANIHVKSDVSYAKSYQSECSKPSYTVKLMKKFDRKTPKRVSSVQHEPKLARLSEALQRLRGSYR